MRQHFSGFLTLFVLAGWIGVVGLNRFNHGLLNFWKKGIMGNMVQIDDAHAKTPFK
jgi:hypothetical protein